MNYKHGLTKDPLYLVWKSMRKRCGVTKGSTEAVKRSYVDRGITVCKEWLEFKPFYEWAKNKWRKGLALDRKDNNGSYTPKNCRFVTQKTNTQNAVRSKRWYIKGKKYNSSRDAAKALGVANITVCNWCNGHTVGKKFHPPKKDCYAVDLYNPQSQPETPSGMLKLGRGEETHHSTLFVKIRTE